MKKDFKKYEIPEQNELIANFTIDCFADEHIKFCESHIDYVESRLIAALADELKNKLTWYMYKKSKTTGRIYDGFYNYVQVNDPMCDTVYEARFDLFSNALKRVKELESRVAEQNDIISKLNRKIYESAGE